MKDNSHRFCVAVVVVVPSGTSVVEGMLALVDSLAEIAAEKNRGVNSPAWDSLRRKHRKNTLYYGCDTVRITPSSQSVTSRWRSSTKAIGSGGQPYLATEAFPS